MYDLEFELLLLVLVVAVSVDRFQLASILNTPVYNPGFAAEDECNELNENELY
jgi:hypothetical protein